MSWLMPYGINVGEVTMSWKKVLKSKDIDRVVEDLNELKNIHDMIIAIETLGIKSNGGWRLYVLSQERDVEPYDTGFRTREELLSYLKRIKAEMGGMEYEVYVKPIGNDLEDNNDYLYR